MNAYNDRVEVSVEEGSDPQMRAVYQLTSDAVPVSVGFSDGYWEAHRRMEREGRLDHGIQDCPVRREGMAVRIWEPHHGWADQIVPVDHPR